MAWMYEQCGIDSNFPTQQVGFSIVNESIVGRYQNLLLAKMRGNASIYRYRDGAINLVTISDGYDAQVTSGTKYLVIWDEGQTPTI